MEDSNKVTTIAKSIPRFDGKDKHELIDFEGKLKAILSLSAPDIYNILMGEESPTPTEGSNLVKWERNNTNLYSMLFLATSGGAAMVVKRYAGRTAREGLGNGQKVWKALEEKYNACSNATREELYDYPNNTKLLQGQDPDEFLYHMEIARNRLYEMGEQITDGYFSDMILTALPPEYEFVLNTSFRDREFTLGDIMSTMRNMYTDLLSRPSSTPSVAGRVVAMHVQGDLNGITCHICKDQGHYQKDCPKYDPNYRKSSNRRQPAKKGHGDDGGGGTKWCSLHRSMMHSDAECKVQQQQANNGDANVAIIQHPCQHANVASMQHPFQQATVANIQPSCQRTKAANVQQQCQHANVANVSHPCLFSSNARQQPEPAPSAGATGAAGGFQGGFSYMATTTAADDTVPTISFDETSDEGWRAKSLVMLGRDHLLDGPSAATVGLFGEPIDFSVLMAVTEPYNHVEVATNSWEPLNKTDDNPETATLNIEQLTNSDMQGGQLLHGGQQNGQQPLPPADNTYLPKEAGGAIGVRGATTAGHQRELQQLNYLDWKARVNVQPKVEQTPDD